MRRFGIQLNALRAFEAAARLSSVSLAAEELNVSHSTISHHIKGLEASIGVDLFLRQNRRIILTKAGQNLLPVLTTAFDNISLTLNTLTDNDERAPLRVTVTPTFASRWLVPRLKRFRDQHKNVDVKLKSSLSASEFKPDRFNIGVRTGLGRWPGLNAEFLTSIHMTPMCSPKLLKGRNMLSPPDELSAFTLIHGDINDELNTQSEWQTWLNEAGAQNVHKSGGLSFEDPALALQAATDGLGIAMGYVELAEKELSSGQLVQPFPLIVPHAWPYYIVTPENSDDNEQVRLFSDWLHDEAKRR